MERLTFVKCPKYWNTGRHPTKYTSRKTFQEVVDRLAHYEDMEEQGRLQIFPCAPGATVYVTDVVDGKAVPCEVLCFGDIDGSGDMTVEYKVPKEIPNVVSMLCSVSEFGKTVFLTCEEAENALNGGAK